MFLAQETKDARTALVEALKEAIAGRRVSQNRLWIDLLVRKPDHRSDALNFIDQIADAVKEAVSLDDNWFSLRRLDWEIAKDEPVFYIGIGQESDIDLYACSYCGRLLEASAFGANKSTKSGLARTCRECSRMGGRIDKRQRQLLEGQQGVMQ